MKKKFSVSIPSLDKIFQLEEGVTLLHGLRGQDIEVKSVCDGQASCGECIIKVLSGGAALSEPTFYEENLLGNVFHLTKERLSCQVTIHADVVIEIGK